MRKQRGATIILLTVSGALCLAQSPAAQPDTVLVTLRAKPGAEAALQEVLARHWSMARALNLVRDEPHVTLRSAEQGNKTTSWTSSLGETATYPITLRRRSVGFGTR